MAKRKADVAFEFFYKLNVPFYCFHDVDVSPEGESLKSYQHNGAYDRGAATETAGERREAAMGHRQLLYPSALRRAPPPIPIQKCSHGRRAVCSAMQATHQLGGENYVLWGGREGYETLLNTDLRRSASSLAALCRWWWSISIKPVSGAPC